MRKQSKGLALTRNIKLLLVVFVVSGLVLATCGVSQAQGRLGVLERAAGIQRTPEEEAAREEAAREEARRHGKEAVDEMTKEFMQETKEWAGNVVESGKDAAKSGYKAVEPAVKSVTDTVKSGYEKAVGPAVKSIADAVKSGKETYEKTVGPKEAETGGKKIASPSPGRHPDDRDPDVMDQFKKDLEKDIMDYYEDAVVGIGSSYEAWLERGKRDYDNALEELGLTDDKRERSENQKKAKTMLDETVNQYRIEVTNIYKSYINELHRVNKDYKEIIRKEWKSEMRDKQFMDSANGHRIQAEKRFKDMVEMGWINRVGESFGCFSDNISDISMKLKKEFGSEDETLSLRDALRNKSTKGKNGKLGRGDRQGMEKMRHRLERGRPSGPSSPGGGGGGGGGGPDDPC